MDSRVHVCVCVSGVATMCASVANLRLVAPLQVAGKLVASGKVAFVIEVQLLLLLREVATRPLISRTTLDLASQTETETQTQHRGMLQSPLLLLRQATMATMSNFAINAPELG